MAGDRGEELSKLDPEFDAFLKTLPTPPDVSTLSIPAWRAALASRKAAFNATWVLPTDDMRIAQLTVPASRDGHPIPIRTYVPTVAPEGGSPLIVVFHGGGFCIGDMDAEEANARLWVTHYGASVVNVEYRLAPEHRFPAAPLDGWDVVVWAAKNAASLPANPAAGFLLAGTSAGATISAALMHRARDLALSPPLTGAGLIIPALTVHDDPPAKFKDELRSLAQNAGSPVLGAAHIDRFMAEYRPASGDPLHDTLRAERFDGLPPVFLQVCGADPLRDEALIYERLVREAGGRTKLQVYPGVPHAFWSVWPAWDKSKQFVNETTEGIGWLLKQGKE